ncbi:MAG: porin family protein [Pseudomonadota bacterium]
MKQRRYGIAAAGMALFTSMNVAADDAKGAYVSAVAGVGFLGSQDLNYRDATTTSTAEADFSASFAGGATLGYRFNDAWRIEGELMYRRNDMDAITLDGVGVSAEGDFASLSTGISALYDFRPFDNDRLSAYVGIGAVFVQEIDIDFEVDSQEVSFETDEVGIQLQLGGRYDFNDAWFLDVGLRYLNVSEVEMQFPSDTSRIVEADYSPVTLSVGLGWRF